MIQKVRSERGESDKEDAMFKITNLVKTPNTDPQEFTLVLKDLDNTKKGYLHSTEHGTESEMRKLLKSSGVSDTDIDAAFNRAQVG